MTNIINFPDRTDEEPQEEQLKKHVDELLDRIDAIKKQPGKNSIIRKMYKEAIRFEEEHNLPRLAAYEYCSWLQVCHQSEFAIPLARHYLAYWEQAGDRERIGEAHSMLGKLYGDTNRGDESEREFLLARECFKPSAEAGSFLYQRAMSAVSDNLGKLYMMLNRFDDAERELRRAAEITEGLKDRYKYENDLSITYINMGLLYMYQNRYFEALKYLLLAKDLLKRSAATSPETFGDNMAIICINLGVTYSEMQRFRKAEREYLQAKSIYERLDGNSSGAWSSGHKHVLMNLLTLYEETGQSKKAEKIREKIREADEYEVIFR